MSFLEQTKENPEYLALKFKKWHLLFTYYVNSRNNQSKLIILGCVLSKKLYMYHIEKYFALKKT